MRKAIEELTNVQARDALSFVFPKDNMVFTDVAFESEVARDGYTKITWGGELIIGIKYRNSFGDGCVLPFHDLRLVLWLYRNEFEIDDLLLANRYVPQMEDDFDDLAFAVKMLSKGEDGFKEGFKQNWTLEYVKNRSKELLDKYYYKDYM